MLILFSIANALNSSPRYVSINFCFYISYIVYALLIVIHCFQGTFPLSTLFTSPLFSITRYLLID